LREFKGGKRMNFEDIFKEMEEFQKRMIESFSNDFELLEKEISNGNLKGEWKFEPIEKPGVQGFIARGYFSNPTPLERPEGILPPLRPKQREPREPLYDINVRDKVLQIFIELPGVEEEEIDLDLGDGKITLTAGDFKTEIDISAWIIDYEEMTTEYRNGVFTISIPKKGLREQMV